MKTLYWPGERLEIDLYSLKKWYKSEVPFGVMAWTPSDKLVVSKHHSEAIEQTGRVCVCESIGVWTLEVPFEFIIGVHESYRRN